MHQMKKKRLMVVLLSVASVLLIAATPVAAGDLYFGAKTGKAILDASGVSKDATNTGVLIGWEQSVVLGDIGVEAEYTTTTGDGEIGALKFDVDTIAAYVAFRTGGPIYLKAKGGFLQVDQTILGQSGTDSGASYGVGIGFGIGIAQLELEYTQTALDVDLAYVSVGVQF